MERKFSAWKKNKKFGDVYGGRGHPKFEDHIFARCHSLQRPNSRDQLPILIEDNPSRDFFFPISAQEARDAMKCLPGRDYAGITHIWCRRAKKSDYVRGDLNWASYICGSGVHLIVLYPWPKSMIVTWNKKPSNKLVNNFQRYSIQIHKRGTMWLAKPTHLQLQRLYVEYLLYHEIGHHVDRYNLLFSKSNVKKQEEFADQYAFHKTSIADHVVNRLNAGAISVID